MVSSFYCNCQWAFSRIGRTHWELPISACSSSASERTVSLWTTVDHGAPILLSSWKQHSRATTSQLRALFASTVPVISARANLVREWVFITEIAVANAVYWRPCHVSDKRAKWTDTWTSDCNRQSAHVGAHEGGLRWEKLANRGVSCQERGGVAHKGGHRKPLINMGVKLLHKVPNALGKSWFSLDILSQDWQCFNDERE